MKESKIFPFLYLSLAAIDLFFVWSFPEYRWATKPLILLSLLTHFYINVSEWTFTKRIFWAGLVAALLGDIFLLFAQEFYFLLGLGSFLIMQILYSFAFFKNSFRLSIAGLFFAVLLALLLYFYMNQLWGQLGEMRIPVLVYSTVIAFMTFFAVTRDSLTQRYWWVVIGAILFMISDGFIAWTKFNEPLKYGGLIVMLTYILAQYFITTGFLKSLEPDYDSP